MQLNSTLCTLICLLYKKTDTVQGKRTPTYTTFGCDEPNVLLLRLYVLQARLYVADGIIFSQVPTVETFHPARALKLR
jgi:hypothetical protein